MKVIAMVGQSDSDGRSLPTKSLVLSLEEISKEEYLKRDGQQGIINDPAIAFAQRIGIIKVDQTVLEPSSLNIYDHLLVKVFDEKIYKIKIKSITDHQGSYHKGSVSARGSVEDFRFSAFVISITDNQVLAVLRLVEKNVLYTVRYNNFSSQYYLYETPLDKFDNCKEY